MEIRYKKVGKRLMYTNDEFFTNEGYKIKIIEYLKNSDYVVQFEDGGIVTAHGSSIKKGGVKNPNHFSVYGKGFIGYGKYETSYMKEPTIVYIYWKSMLSRCYSSTCLKTQRLYRDCSVVVEWHNFQNFAAWFEENYNPETMQGWHLDKDILIKGNKIYSPETCCFVPREINNLYRVAKSNSTLPIGVRENRSKFIATLNRNYLGTFDNAQLASCCYENAKQACVKELAEKWKFFISKEVYKSMHNYLVC